MGIHRGVVKAYREPGKDSTKTPLYICPDGKVIPDSWSILSYAGWTIDEPFRLLLSEKLGLASRRLAYYYLLQCGNMLKEIQEPSSWWHSIQFFFLWMTVDLPAIIRNKFHINDSDGYSPAADVAIVEEVFEEVERRLSIKGPYLGENGEFGGADIAFASLAAPVIWPDQSRYADGSFNRYPLAGMPQGLIDLATAFRRTVAGQHVQKVYAEHRP